MLNQHPLNPGEILEFLDTLDREALNHVWEDAKDWHFDHGCTVQGAFNRAIYDFKNLVQQSNNEELDYIDSKLG